MEEKRIRMLETLYREAGFGETLPDDVKAKMTEGVPEITHPVSAQKEAEEILAVVRLKRAAGGEFYFLDGFDLQVRPFGQAEVRNHRFDSHYSLAEGYNLLSGRPVLRTTGVGEDWPVQVWERLDLKHKLANGNYNLKRTPVDENFNLEKILKQYPIRELEHPKEAARLLDDLRRGDSGKVSFIDSSGKEVKLTVTPNIGLRSLNVYDENGQRIPTPTLVERQLIRANRPSLKAEQKAIRPAETVTPAKQRRKLRLD